MISVKRIIMQSQNSTNFINVNGIRMAYDVSGSGKNIVVLHGMSSSKETMFTLRDDLMDSYKIYTLDLRGHGESDRMDNYTIQDLADDVIEFVQKLGLENVTLIGYSMGSFVALRACECEDIFDKLILIGTKVDSSKPAITNLLKEMGLTIDKVTKEEYGKIMSENIFAPMTKLPINIKTYPSKGEALSPMDRLAETRSIADFDNLKDIDKVKAQTLVISAEYDKIVPPERGFEVAQALNCKFELIKEAGHMMMHEKAEELACLIKKFVK